MLVGGNKGSRGSTVQSVGVTPKEVFADREDEGGSKGGK